MSFNSNNTSLSQSSSVVKPLTVSKHLEAGYSSLGKSQIRRHTPAALEARRVAMLEAALRYAALGLPVFPVHVPIFDTDGRCVGCTCEDYRHDEKCSPRYRLDTDERCDTPGKCPAFVNFVTGATTDEATIREWFSKPKKQFHPLAGGYFHFIPNLAVRCDNLCIIDHDTYKAEYDGHEIMLLGDTPLQMAQGVQQWFRMPDGMRLGMGTGDLPGGCDVRAGASAYACVAPSMHWTGVEYHWDENFDLFDDMPLAPLPGEILALLPVGGGVPVESVVFGKSVDCPDLKKLRLNEKAWHLLNHGHEEADRSSADYRLCLAVARKLSDEQILAMFQSYPIGINGKFAEAGEGYLAKTIAKARAYLAEQDAQQKTGDDDTPPGSADESSGASVADSVAILSYERLDDEGNAQCVHAYYGKRFAYNEGLGWLHYNGTHWQSEGAEAALDRAVVDTLLERIQVATRSGNPDLIKAVAAKCAPYSGKLNGTKAMLRSIAYVPASDFDTDPDVINCKNGLLHLPTGTITPHSPEQRVTHCINSEYIPETDYSALTHWMKGEIEPEQADWLQQFAGYSLTGHTREEVLVYLHGKPRSGKGTLTEMINELLGKPLSKEVPFSTFSQKRDGDSSNFDLAPLRACRVALASESKTAERLNEAVIKRVTGGNDVYCSFKHKEHFNYRPQYKIWLSSNHPVNADADDDAVWGRLRVIYFKNSYLDNEDKLFKVRMKSPEMLRQLLAWAVDGAKIWYESGSKGLPEPVTMKQVKSKHRGAVDYVKMWLDDYCILVPNAFESHADLHRSYAMWCENNGAEPLGAKRFTESLENKGFTYHRTNKKRGMVGIRIGDLPNVGDFVTPPATPPVPAPAVSGVVAPYPL